MNLGMPEMLFILLLALVIVGPKKLPEVARQLGKFLAEFKRASNDFKHQIEAEMLNIELQERAKKQAENPAADGKLLPPDEPWERLMRPLADTVSRTRQELVAVATSAPEPPTPAPAEPPAASRNGADRT